LECLLTLANRQIDVVRKYATCHNNIGGQKRYQAEMTRKIDGHVKGQCIHCASNKPNEAGSSSW